MSDIKECFVSRFANHGKIVSLDFSQLEIWYLAFITQDKQLLADAASGRDLHRMRAAELFDIAEADVTKIQRTLAKELSFELQYGAGATSMAGGHKLPKEVCQKFIDNYYARYPRVKEWQGKLIAEVKGLRQSTTKLSKKGHPLGVSKYRSITGRIYTFNEYDAPEWMSVYTDKRTGEKKPRKDPVFTAISPTEVKNHPIQGGGSDLVAITRGRLMRQMLKHDWYMEQVLPIMTVHDSIEFDCVTEYVDPACEVIQYVVDRLPVYFEKEFGVELNVKFPVEIKVGPNWMQMEKRHA